MVFWKNFLEKLIDDFKKEGYNINHIEEMNIIAIANKMDIAYDFLIKHNMCSLEWKLYSMTKKNKALIIKCNRNWRHSLKRKCPCYRDQ